jgi:hypothetical protein
MLETMCTRIRVAQIERPLRSLSSPSDRFQTTIDDCLDIGIALGSPVSLDDHEDAPFKFNGAIEPVHVAK